MSGFSKKISQKGKTFIRRDPVNLLPEHAPHFHANKHYTCPDLNVYFFDSISFLPDSTLFRYGFLPLDISFLFYRKRIKHHSIKGILDIRRRWKKVKLDRTAEPYLIIHDPWTTNYYHWITQALPRLLLAKQTNNPYRLLLPNTHLTEFHIKSLKALGVEDWETIDVGETWYQAPSLMYPSHDIQVGDYHDDLMKELSSELRRGKNTSVNGELIFVHRKSHVRRIVNEDAVLSVFNSFGFRIVNFETLTFEEQMRLASGASVLAGVHGAGLTNMIFMAKDSKVLELTPILNGEQYYYYTLSNALGHDYYYQACQPDVPGKTIQESNLIVDIDKLKHILQQMTDTK